MSNNGGKFREAFDGFYFRIHELLRPQLKKFCWSVQWSRPRKLTIRVGLWEGKFDFEATFLQNDGMSNFCRAVYWPTLLAIAVNLIIYLADQILRDSNRFQTYCLQRTTPINFIQATTNTSMIFSDATSVNGVWQTSVTFNLVLENLGACHARGKLGAADKNLK